MKCIGVAQHNPLYVQGCLQKVGTTPYILPVNSSAKTKKVAGCEALFVLTFKDLLANLDLLNGRKLEDKPVFVFASVLRLCELDGVHALDYVPERGLRYKLTRLTRDRLRATLRAKPLPVKVDQPDLLPVLIKSVQEGSFLSPLMTAVYQLPLSQQTALKLDVLQWAYSDKPLPTLMARLRSRTFSPGVIDALEATLAGKESSAMREALAYVRQAKKEGKKAVNYKKLVQQFGVSRYEVRYILKVLKTDDLYRVNDGKTLEDIYYSRPRNSKKGV